MSTAPGALRLRAEAADADNLQHMKDLVTAHLSRFSRRNRLTVEWQAYEN
jgi:hypothetical protein